MQRFSYKIQFDWSTVFEKTGGGSGPAVSKHEFNGLVARSARREFTTYIIYILLRWSTTVNHRGRLVIIIVRRMTAVQID